MNKSTQSATITEPLTPETPKISSTAPLAEHTSHASPASHSNLPPTIPAPLPTEPPAPAENLKSEFLSPKFPSHCLPPALHAIATEISETTWAPIEYAATACLGITSAAIGAGTHIVDGPRLFRPNLYFLTQSSPDTTFASAFQAAQLPLVLSQKNADSDWHNCLVPDTRVEREGLLRSKAQTIRERGIDQTERNRTLCEIERDLAVLRHAMQRPPLLFLSGSISQRLVQRVARNPNESLAILTTDHQDLAPVLRAGPTSSAETRLAQSLLSAGYTGNALTHLGPGGQHQCMQPCLTVLSSYDSTETLFTPETLRDSRLLPCFLTLDCSRASDPYPELPLAMKSIKHQRREDWYYLIKKLLFLRKDDFSRRFMTTPAARVLLRDYENECRRAAKTTCADIPSYPLHWSENAWRLTILFHTTNHADLLTRHYPNRHRAFPSPEPEYLDELIPEPQCTGACPCNCTASPCQCPCTCPITIETEIVASAGRPQPNLSPSHPASVSTEPPTPSTDITTPESAPTHATRHTTPATEPSASSPNLPTPDDEPPRPPRIPPVHDRDLPPIPAETAAAAITLMRWFADHQLLLLAPARRRLPLFRDALLAHLVEKIERAGGRLTLTDLKRSTNQLKEHEIRALAARYSGLLSIAPSEIQAATGPRTQTVTLHQNWDPLPITQNLQNSNTPSENPTDPAPAANTPPQNHDTLPPKTPPADSPHNSHNSHNSPNSSAAPSSPDSTSPPGAPSILSILSILSMPPGHPLTPSAKSA